MVIMENEFVCAQAASGVLGSVETPATLCEGGRQAVHERCLASAYAGGFFSIAERARAQCRPEMIKALLECK